MQIEVDMSGVTPVYKQIVHQIKRGVLSGALSAGDALPSIRQLASDLALNHNTVAKAYKQLEKQHVTISAGRKGTCIRERAIRYIRQANSLSAELQLEECVASLRAKGMNNRDSGSLETLYNSHWNDLCGYIHAKFGAGPPEPADVAQATFTRFAGLDEPERVKNPKAFLFATARNIVIDHFRREMRFDAYVDDVVNCSAEISLEAITPERVSLAKERFRILNETVKRLPHKQQVVLSLSRFHGLNYSEISKKTGWSMSDISRQIKKAIHALDKALR